MGIGSSGVVNCANTYLGTANYTVADGYVADRTVIVDGNGPAQLNLNFARDEVLDPRITFSRTSNATRVNTQGLIEYAPHNLLTYSENFDNAAWTKRTGSTIIANSVPAPNGTTTADTHTNTNTTTNGTYIRYTGAFANDNTVYTASYYVKQGSTATATIQMFSKLGTGSYLLVTFDLVLGTYIVSNVGSVSGGTGGMVNVGNGWWRIWATANMLSGVDTTGLQLVPSSWGLPTAIESEYGYIWGAQLNIGSLQPYYTTSVKNLLGYSQNFENAAWTKSNSSVLTNLLTYSQEFDNAVWVKGVGLTVSPNTAISPDGLQNADTITPNGAGAISSIYYDNITVTASTSYTFSIYVKLGTLAASDYKIAVYNVTGSAFIAVDVTPTQVPNTTGWTRISYTFTTPVGCISARVYPYRSSATVNATMYFYGAQLVQGTNPEEYTVTTSAAAPIQVMGSLGFLGAEKLVENTATGVPHGLAVDTSSLSSTTQYTLSVYAKAGERTWVRLGLVDNLGTDGGRAWFDLSTGVVGTVETNGAGSNINATITSIGANWYRCRLTIQMNNGKTTLQSQVRLATANNVLTYTGDGSSGVYIFGAQLSDSASLDPYSYNFGAAPTSSVYYGPRFDYDPVTLAPKGLLIEESRTNLIKASENLSAVTWNKTGTPVLDSLIQDPSGNINTVYYPTVSEIYQIFDGAGVGTISLSFFGKKREGSSNNQIIIQIYQQVSAAVVDLGTYGFSLVASNPDSTYFKNIKREQYQNGWYRFSCQIVANTGAGTGNFSPSSRIDIEGGSAQNYVWGIQVELNTFPTSYIPTTSAQVTRAADNASMVGTNFSSWYNQSEGTLVGEFDMYNAAVISGAFPRVISISNGTNSNLIDLQSRQYANEDFSVTDAAVVQCTITLAQFTANTFGKLAGTYQVNNFQAAANGVLGTADLLGTVPTVNQLQLGNRWDMARPMSGHIKSFKYFNKRLLNSYLQSLTQ